MAVAPHVSRVAKDYAPHGYSIREEFIGEVTTGSGSLDEPEFINKIIVGDSGDIYIEEVKIIGYDAIAADNTNYLTLQILSYVSGGGTVVTHASTDTRAANNGALVEDTIYDVAVTTPVVSGSPNRVLGVAVSRSADHTDINGKTINMSVRYRRKA